MVLVPNSNETVLFSGSRKKQPIRGVRQEVNRIGRTDLPNTCPARARQVTTATRRGWPTHVKFDARLCKKNGPVLENAAYRQG